MIRKDEKYFKRRLIGFLIASIVARTVPSGASLMGDFRLNVFGVERAEAAITLVQTAKCTVSNTTSTMSCAFANVPQDGDAVFAVIGERATSTIVSSITETGTAWSNSVKVASSSGATVEIWAAANVSGAATSTKILFSRNATATAVLAEFAGIATSSILDVSATTTSAAAGTSAQTGVTATTTVASEVWLGGLAAATGTATNFTSPTGNFSIGSTSTVGVGAGGNASALLYKVVTSTLAKASSSATISSANWAGAIAAYKVGPPPGVPGTPTYTNVNTSTLTVNWTAATSSDWYTVQRATSSNGTYVSQTPTTTALTWNDSGLSAVTTYWYKIFGTNGGNDGSPSASSSATTTAVPPSVTSFTNNTRALTDGGKSSDSITLTGTNFGTVSAGSRANCAGDSSTGCIQIGTPISFVQSSSNSLSSGASISKTFGSNVTAGNTIIVAVGWGATSTASVADSAGNTYVSTVTSTNSGGTEFLQIFYAKNVTGGTINVTSTFSTSTQYMRIGIEEYSGLDTSAPFDVATAVSSSVSSINPISGTSTTNFANELLFGSVYTGATTNPNAGANFTRRDGLADFGTQDRIVSSAGSYSAPWSTTTSTAWLAAMATFKAGGQAKVADADITAWSNTSISFNVSTTLATLGGVGALQVFASSTGSNTSTFYVYPSVTGMAVCTGCNANSAREYNASDTDGLIMLQGDHFGSTTGTVWFGGSPGFGNLTSTIHTSASVPCTTSGWGGTNATGSNVCAEVPATIANNIYTGTVSLQRNDASGTVSAWGNAKSLPSAIYQHSAVAYNGYIYTTGGVSVGNFTSTVFQTPINATGSLGTWVIASSSLPSKLAQHSAVAYNGYIYTMGGYNGNTNTSTVFQAPINANGSLGTWVTASSSLPSAINNYSAVAYNGYIYTTGGQDNGSVVTSTVFQAPINANGSLGTWVQASSSLPSKLAQHSAFAYNGYIYTTGGFDSGSNLTSTVFQAPINANGSLGTWVKASSSLPSGIYNHSAVTYNGYIYTTGGRSATAVTSTVFQAPINANGSLGTWVKASSSLPSVIYSHSAVTYNGYIYTMGGYTGAYTSTVYYATVGKNDPISLRILPRITSSTPTNATSGTTIDIKGNHFCESGTCPVSPNRANSTDNVKFGSTTSTDADFQNTTGGAGTCNGTGAAWTDSEACVKVPAGAPTGSASTTITSNTSYTSNAYPFTVNATPSTIPNDPGALNQFSGATAINVGSSTATTTIVFKANISSTQAINMALQIEATSTANSFACASTSTCSASDVYQGATYTNITSLSNASATAVVSSTGDTGTSYHWQARVRNTTTNEYSNWVSFPAAPSSTNAESSADFISDINPPAITSLASSSVSTSTATITWNTSGETATARVQYKTSTAAFAASCVTDNDCTAISGLNPPGGQSVNLTGLATSTTYYFRARSQDALGNESISATSSFATTSTISLPVTGQVTSVPFDTATSAAYNSLVWKGTAGTGKVQFQFATSNSSSGPWTFYGSSDGGVTCDSNHWYDTTSPDVPVAISCAPQNHNNQRYYRYKIQLCSNTDCSTVGTTSPIVSSAVISWSP